MVVSALDALHGGQRMVGIVTHVRDLAERLPARLEVRRQGSSVDRVDRLAGDGSSRPDGGRLDDGGPVVAAGGHLPGAGPAGGSGSGTRFLIAGIVRRYA